MPIFAYTPLVGQRLVFPAMLVTLTGNRLSQAVITRFRPLGFYEDGNPIDADPAYGFYSVLTPAGGHECPIVIVAASVLANSPAVTRRFMIQNLATEPPTSLPQAPDSGADTEGAVPTASGVRSWSLEISPAQPAWGVKLQPLTASHSIFLQLRQDFVSCCRRVNGRLGGVAGAHLYHLRAVAPRVGFGVSASTDVSHYDPLLH